MNFNGAKPMGINTSSQKIHKCPIIKWTYSLLAGVPLLILILNLISSRLVPKRQLDYLFALVWVSFLYGAAFLIKSLCKKEQYVLAFLIAIIVPPIFFNVLTFYYKKTKCENPFNAGCEPIY